MSSYQTEVENNPRKFHDTENLYIRQKVLIREINYILLIKPIKSNALKTGSCELSDDITNK